MKKRLFAILLAGALLGFAGCQGVTGDPNGTEGTTTGQTESGTQAETNEAGATTPDLEAYKTTVAFKGDVAGIRLLGSRRAESATQLNADYIGSGLEFVIDCKGGTLTLRTATDDRCYFRAWVDGEVWNNTDGTPYYMVNGVKNLVLPAMPEGVHMVRVVKVTDYTLTRAHFYSMTFYGTLRSEQVPADAMLMGEFIGSDLAAGMGVLNAEQAATYQGQDGTLAYPWLVAGSLKSDCTVTAFAGNGLLSGSLALQGSYLLASPLRDATQYGFSRTADYAVLDLGSVDAAAGVTAEQFQDAYIKLIQNVYTKNGEACKIYCVYRTGDVFAGVISEVCQLLGGEAAGIYSLCLDQPAGACATAQEQQAYATALATLIGDTVKAPVTQKPGLDLGSLNAIDRGNGMEIGYDDPKWNA